MSNASDKIGQRPNQSHAWTGTWDRPMKIDENSLDPLTVARMTDHNVRGIDAKKGDSLSEANPSKAEVIADWENEGGAVPSVKKAKT